MSLLTSRIAKVARNEPARRAVSDGERQIDYGTLWLQANAFAAFLRGEAGAVAGDRIAVILPNCIEAIVACYGSWLAGCVIVPLNAQAKARDFEPWLRHCEARVVVHEASHRDTLLALDAMQERPLSIVTDAGADASSGTPWSRVIGAPSSFVPSAPDSGDLAMIVYTSGTTGQPKGVMLSHANLAANVESIIGYLGLGPKDSIVTVLPFYYSYGASVLHTHLAVGARLVIESNLVFPHLMVETMARERVSGFSGVPSTFTLLLNRVALDQYDLSALRYVTQAGGAMAPATTARLHAALPHVRLFIMYGQTEATARLAWLPPEQLEAKSGSVGIPIPGVEIEVRSENGHAQAPLEDGDVYVRGANVMLGYWRDPQASANVLQGGWLRTGDMGHLDADGYLFLCGRRSDMIKTGAHRVHPQDVEEVIAELPGIVEVAVVGIDDETLGQVIKAFIVVDADAQIAINQVKAHCRDRLAAYKIPKFIESVAALPKTASGKIRRTQLAAPTEPREVS